nr:hypothetical protein HT590_00335 [Enterobacter ludwigii]
MVGKNFDWEMPGAPGTPLSKGGSLPAGTYTSTGCTSGNKDRCEKHIREQIADFQSGASGFRLLLVMNAVETTFTPEVTWVLILRSGYGEGAKNNVNLHLSGRKQDHYQ